MLFLEWRGSKSLSGTHSRSRAFMAGITILPIEPADGAKVAKPVAM